MYRHYHQKQLRPKTVTEFVCDVRDLKFVFIGWIGNFQQEAIQIYTTNMSLEFMTYRIMTNIVVEENVVTCCHAVIFRIYSATLFW